MWTKQYWKEYRKNYHIKNRIKLNKKNKKYYSENKEKIKRLRIIYCQKNKEKIKERNKKWRVNNKEYFKKYFGKDKGLYMKYLLACWRCNSNNEVKFKSYKGKGIKFLWDSYNEFKKDMYMSYIKHLKQYGKKQTTLDRIDNDGNYCKENCRWATMLEQANNKRNTKSVVY